MVSWQKDPTRHDYAWQIGPFWQDTLEFYIVSTMAADDKTPYHFGTQILWENWANTMAVDALPRCFVMGLLPNTQNCGCACARNAGNVFPATAGKQFRQATRHVRDARAVMHAGIVNSRFPLNLASGENVPGIPGACATRNFTYLVRGPCLQHHLKGPCFLWGRLARRWVMSMIISKWHKTVDFGLYFAPNNHSWTYDEFYDFKRP